MNNKLDLDSLDKVSGGVITGDTSKNEQTINGYRYYNRTYKNSMAESEYYYLIKKNSEVVHHGYYQGIYNKPGALCTSEPYFIIYEDFDDKSGSETNRYLVAEYNVYKTRDKI